MTPPLQRILRGRRWREQNPDSAREYRQFNRDRILVNQRKWAAENSEKCKASQLKYRTSETGRTRVREQARERKYGVGVNQHIEVQLESQDHRCAICRQEFSSPRDIQFDHNHDTQQWRGILCATCNTRLGSIEDPEWYPKALAYLKFWADKARLGK